MYKILELFLFFLKIGFTSYGGGYAILSNLQTQAVSKNYLTSSQFSDIVAISQVTPGPIAVNMATFIGYKHAGIFGSLAATLGVCLPSILIALGILKLLKKYKNMKFVDNIFNIMRPITVAFIFVICYNFAKEEVFYNNQNFFDLGKYLSERLGLIFILVISFLASYVYKIKTYYIITFCTILGFVIL